MKYKFLTCINTLLISSTGFAAPNDLFLEAYAPNQNQKLNLSVSLDAVNDTVDVFDIRESEGLNSEAGDYLGAHLIADYRITPEWAIEGQYWYREIDFAGSTNKVNTGALAIKYQPEWLSSDKSQWAFKASVWGNQADELLKATPTMIEKNQIDQIRVDQPKDLQFQFDTIFSHTIDPMNRINLFGSFGYSKVEIERLNIRAQHKNCENPINISINNNNQYQLSEPCSQKGWDINVFPITGDASQFGFNVQEDLNYEAYYAGIGGSWNWRYKKFESQLAYQYQKLWRDNLDDRISQLGSSPIDDNHSIGAKFSYDFSKKMTGFVKAEMYENNLIGYLPFLYNGITASRLDKRYGLASIGIQYRGF